jgi:transposase
MAELADWVEVGPDPVRDGVVRWRRKDLQARIAAEFGVTLHERSVGTRVVHWLLSLGDPAQGVGPTR